MLFTIILDYVEHPPYCTCNCEGGSIIETKCYRKLINTLYLIRSKDLEVLWYKSPHHLHFSGLPACCFLFLPQISNHLWCSGLELTLFSFSHSDSSFLPTFINTYLISSAMLATLSADVSVQMHSAQHLPALRQMSVFRAN